MVASLVASLEPPSSLATSLVLSLDVLEGICGREEKRCVA